MSAQSKSWMTCCISSCMQHCPGVRFQHEKQPRQGLIFIRLMESSFVWISWIPCFMPFRNAYVSRQVLLSAPFGLPFITKMFITSFLLPTAGCSPVPTQFAFVNFDAHILPSSANKMFSLSAQSYRHRCIWAVEHALNSLGITRSFS